MTTVDRMRDLAVAALERAADAAGPHVSVERRLSVGPVVDGVTRASEGADLLVIGSRRYGALRRLVLGNHTGPIVHAAPTPVLVLPRRTAEKLDEHVVSLAAASAR